MITLKKIVTNCLLSLLFMLTGITTLNCTECIAKDCGCMATITDNAGPHYNSPVNAGNINQMSGQYSITKAAILKDTTKRDTLPPEPYYYFCLCCGKTHRAYVIDEPWDTASCSKIGSITLDEDSSFNIKLSYDEFIPGTKRIVNWYLQVIDLQKDARAVITFADTAGNDTTISIYYNVFMISVDKPVLDFGKLKIGQEAVREFKVKNINEKSSVDIKSIRIRQDYYYDDFFSFIDKNFDFTLKPFEEKLIKVKFTAMYPGEFVDSINIADTCRSKTLIEVRAEVLVPIIATLDRDFGKVKVGQLATKECIIENKGEVDLVITGIKGPKDTTFYFDSTALKKVLPLTIKPGNNYQFKVWFKPRKAKDYKDAIVVMSDSGPDGDSTIVIIGTGVMGILAANSYNWGSVRIDTETDPRGPYGSDWVPGQPRAVELKNEGNEALMITGLKIEPVTGDPNAFLIDQSAFTMILQPEESRYLDVKFQPTTICEHEIKITYYSTALISPVTTLLGKGVQPKVQVEDMDFGSSVIGDVNTVQSRTVRIINSAYDCADTITITDLQSVPPEAISETPESFGSQGFRYDKNSVMNQTLPSKNKIVLAPGMDASIKADFLAQFDGLHKAELLIVNDAGLTIQSKWTGNNTLDCHESAQNNPVKINIIPNPAGPDGAVARISSTRDCFATVKVYNSLGVEALEAYSGSLAAGENDIPLQTGSLASGVYYLALNTGGRVEMVRFNIIR